MHSRAFGVAETFDVMTGAFLRSAAFLTVTPPNFAVAPLAGFAHAAGFPTGAVDGLGDGEGDGVFLEVL
jgi:hypothetical protein